MNIPVSAAQHEAERESRLHDEKKQVWIPREGLAQRGHPEGLCVSLQGRRGSTAGDLWPSGLLRSADRSTVGALLHEHHGGGAMRSERQKEPLRSASRRPREVKSPPDTSPRSLPLRQKNPLSSSASKRIRSHIIAKQPFKTRC